MKKILGKLLILWFMLSVASFAASVKLEVSSTAIYKGDVASFSIIAQGKDIEFPEIVSIGGFDILNTSSASSVNIINTKITKTKTKTYYFKPTADVLIPPFSVRVDGKVFHTKKQKISVITPKQSKSGDKFIVEMKLDKTKLKVGEGAKLSILLKRRIDVKATKFRINEPKLDNFWVKKIDSSKRYSQGEYTVQEFDYLIFPQKSGHFTIGSIEADVGHLVKIPLGGGFFNDPFFDDFNTQMKWEKIYSNELNIDVEPLPNGVELYGDFTISVHVDKTKVYANKPVNVTITINGSGNIDDVQKYDFDIKNVVVYSDNPHIKTSLKDGSYGGVFIQKIAVIGSSDFTIPSFKLKYFSAKENRLKTIQTKPVHIEVIGENIKNTTAKIDMATKKIQSKTTYQCGYTKYLYLLLGVILGVFGSWLVCLKNSKTKQTKQKPLVVKIKNAKSDKELFDILLPYIDNDTVAKTLELLEQNIYQNMNHKIDKQKLYDVFL